MQTLFTKKIYYKKFDHRIVIDIRSGGYSSPKLKPTGEIIEWLLNRRYPEGNWRSMSTYSYIHSTYQCSVFSKGPELYEYLKEQIGEEYITIFEKPMSEEHVALLEGNDKLVTRKQLFYGRYRMCLRVNHIQLGKWQTSSENVKEMQAWCDEQFGTDQERCLVSGWSRGNFYFKDPKDALLFKLTWGGQDVKTERVITLAELEATTETA